MGTDTLKKYIENIVLLELSLYSQKALSDRVESEIEKLENFTGEVPAPERSAKDHIRWLHFAAAWGLSALFGLALGASPSFFALQGILAGLSAGVLTTAVLIFGALLKAKRENLKIRESNRVLAAENESARAITNQKAILLKKERSALGSLYSRTSGVLKQYYDKNIIPPTYRTLRAAASIHENLTSGKCAALGGPGGAFALCAKEAFLQPTFDELDALIGRPESAGHRPQMFEAALRESRAETERLIRKAPDDTVSLQNLENSPEFTAYLSAAATKNASLLAWLDKFPEEF